MFLQKLFIIYILCQSLTPLTPTPKTFTWANHKNKNYLTKVLSENSPKYCKSDWAISTTSIISDKILIIRKNRFPEINLSPQIILDYENYSKGCNGGTPDQAFSYILKNNISEDNCSNYRAESKNQINAKCTSYV